LIPGLIWLDTLAAAAACSLGFTGRPALKQARPGKQRRGARKQLRNAYHIISHHHHPNAPRQAKQKEGGHETGP